MMKTTVRTNQRAQRCSHCGEVVPIGHGRLVHIDQDWLDDNDDFTTRPGWHVYHLDEALCKRNRDAAKQKASEEKAKADALKALKQIEQESLCAQMQSRGLAAQMDWSWDDDRFDLGAVLAETEHYLAREYFDSYPHEQGKRLIGFVLKEKK